MPVSTKRAIVKKTQLITVKDSTAVEEAMDALIKEILYCADEVDMPAMPKQPDCVMDAAPIGLQVWQADMNEWACNIRDNVQVVSDDIKKAARRLESEIVLANAGTTTVRRR